MSDIEEARLAVQAARTTGLPVIVSLAFDSGKNKDRTMMGATPEAVAAAMVEAGADAVGANCGVGVELCRAHLPARCMRPAICPIWIKPNAGLPKMEGTAIRYSTSAEYLRFALRGPARGRRLVSGRLLRFHAGLHSRPGERAAPDAPQADQLRSSVPRDVRRLRAFAAPGGPGVSAQGTARPGRQADGGEDTGSGGPHAGRRVRCDSAGLRALRQRARRADRAAYAPGAAARARLHRAADGQPPNATRRISNATPALTTGPPAGWSAAKACSS